MTEILVAGLLAGGAIALGGVVIGFLLGRSAASLPALTPRVLGRREVKPTVYKPDPLPHGVSELPVSGRRGQL